MSWPKPIVTLLRADPGRKILDKDSPLPLAELSSFASLHGASEQAGLQEMKRRHRGAALAQARAQWIADHDR